ncbi:hypothetical protein HYFRA_00006341 [Hymenoscyphus fraxineus]|uniref:Uncharacterized protein n=1 Tax=Hymenoscyphus fraxineus TaxID=746836 RepID=A0A9N9PFW5_9HELO|nr:hypothetical protein HYFRA_00006341 [Hymenoscyphus fraxineus]
MANYSLKQIAKIASVLWKQTRMNFKNKETSSPFLKTVKIWNPNLDRYFELKMMLDTGCEVHNLITWDAVSALQLMNGINPRTADIAICLNGEPLSSIGTLVLRWKGKSFRKIFTTTFQVIDGVSLPWDLILGAQEIEEHGILRFAGFAGSKHILRKEKKGDKAKAEDRRREQDKKAEFNKVKVDNHKRAKEESSTTSKS